MADWSTKSSATTTTTAAKNCNALNWLPSNNGQVGMRSLVVRVHCICFYDLPFRTHILYLLAEWPFHALQTFKAHERTIYRNIFIFYFSIHFVKSDKKQRQQLVLPLKGLFRSKISLSGSVAFSLVRWSHTRIYWANATCQSVTSTRICRSIN